MTQSLTRAALAFALLVVALAAPRAPAQTPAAKDTKEAGTVSGRITSSDGRPLAGVTVSLNSGDPGGDRNKTPPRATTDADGRYRFTNVAAGRYRLQPLAPAYTQVDDRAPAFASNSKTVNLGPGESAEDVDAVLTRGGVITGRVTNSEGRPVIAERVTITRADMRDQQGPLAWAVSPYEFETDDRGVYRVYGLAPGRYIVSVGPDRGPGTISVGVDASPYTRTFYPATTDAAQAKVVEVSAGGEATGIDITLAEAPKRYLARGRVVDAAGKPVAGVSTGYGTLRPDQKSLGSWGSDSTHTDAAGEFVIRNLPPGRYAAFAVNDFGSAPSDNFSEAVPFEIVDGDVSGLVIKVRPGASVSGRITVEGTTDRAVLARVTQLQLRTDLRPASGGGDDDVMYAPSSASQTRINPDGTFRVSGLRPGRLRLGLFNFGPDLRAFTLLGVERGGSDAGEWIEIGAGEQVTGVRLRLGYGTSVVRGIVEVRDGSQPAALPEGVRLNVLARRAGAPNQLFAVNSSDVDARGRFILEGMMGGEYELNVTAGFAIPPRAPGAPNAPPPARFPLVRQNLVVPDGGETSITVVYDLSKPTERRP